jgi:hypothetical protein
MRQERGQKRKARRFQSCEPAYIWMRGRTKELKKEPLEGSGCPAPRWRAPDQVRLPAAGGPARRRRACPPQEGLPAAGGPARRGGRVPSLMGMKSLFAFPRLFFSCVGAGFSPAHFLLLFSSRIAGPSEDSFGEALASPAGGRLNSSRVFLDGKRGSNKYFLSRHRNVESRGCPTLSVLVRERVGHSFLSSSSCRPHR